MTVARDHRSINVLVTSAGRRVELVRCFKAASARLGVMATIVAADAASDAPALYFADSARLASPGERSRGISASGVSTGCSVT